MSQSQPEVDPELRKWASYHGLEDILYGEDKSKWPQQNSALHAGDLAETPLSGLAADRPATPPDGAFYRALDEGTVSQYDAQAGSWTVVSESGSGSLLFAATGNTASIQDRLDDARDGGGIVIVPSGDYPVTDDPLRIYSDTRLLLSQGATIRRAASGLGGLLYSGEPRGGGTNPTHEQNIIVEGGTWDVAGDSYGTNAEGLAFKPATNVTVRDVTVTNIYHWHCITFGAVHDGSILDSRFVDAYSIKDTSGMVQLEEDYENTDDCRNIRIDGCSFVQSNGSGGAAIDSHHASPSGAQQRDVTMRDCYVDGLGNGVYLEDVVDFSARSNVFRNLTNAAFDFDAAVENAQLTDNRLNGAPITDNGTRTLQNGVGTNAGDPSSTGEWSGHGHEGLVVYDTSGGRPYPAYRFVAGQWQSA